MLVPSIQMSTNAINHGLVEIQIRDHSGKYVSSQFAVSAVISELAHFKAISDVVRYTCMRFSAIIKLLFIPENSLITVLLFYKKIK